MIKLPKVVMKKGQEKEIAKKIADFFDDLIFNFMEEVIKEPLNNSKDDLISAIKSGKIVYSGGVFRYKRISNRLAKTIENLGGHYSKYAHGYIIKDIPADINQAISLANIRKKDKVDRMIRYLDDLVYNKDFAQGLLDFDPEVQKMGKSLDDQFKNSMQKINVIPPDITPMQMREIANNYTNNLNYYIKKWTTKEIISLRKDIQRMVFKGVRAENLEELIKYHHNVSDRKAKFLARQETELLVAEYRKNRFKQEGVTKYIWSTVLDGRERKLHRELNGKIFSWDNPPIIDERTGERGNPGEAYNCRCVAIPVIDEEFWNS